MTPANNPSNTPGKTSGKTSSKISSKISVKTFSTNSPENLVRRLEEAREAYYNSDAPLMSDAEYDALEDELRSADPENPYFTTVGFPAADAPDAPDAADTADAADAPDAGAPKVRHRVPMLSMAKAKDLGETEKWLRRLAPEPEWTLAVQPKIDGVSASLLYEGGELRGAATRGDGVQGQDISRITPYLPDIPRRIGFTRDAVEVRGELHLPKDTDYDTGGRPLRNNCVGLINRKEQREDIRHVRFLAYQIIWPEGSDGPVEVSGPAGGNGPVGAGGPAGGNGSFGESSPIRASSSLRAAFSGGTAAPLSALEGEPRLSSEFDKIRILREAGFSTFDSWLLTPESPPEDADALIAFFMDRLGSIYTDYTGSLRDAWNFETDGLILVVNDNRLHQRIDERWVVDHHHHYALAFKPPSPRARTVLKGIAWQVSRQGNLTPVALFEPVRLGGARLERAGLHNAGNVRRLRPALGDTIVVERANDVIPYVRDNLGGGPGGPGGLTGEEPPARQTRTNEQPQARQAENRVARRPRERPEDFTDPALWPEHCPSCRSPLEESGVNITCPNLQCRDRVLQCLLYWVRCAEMEQVALKTLESLYDAGVLRTVRDLYRLEREDFSGLEGFGDKKIDNILRQIEGARTMSPGDFIARLGIPMVQKKSLARLGITTMKDFLGFSDEGYVIGKRITEWKREPGNLELVNELLEVLVLEENTAERRGVLTLTGTAPLPRKTLIAALEKAGWIIAGAVTRETAALLCSDTAAASTKLKKARDAGVPILTYEEFLAENPVDLGLGSVKGC